MMAVTTQTPVKSATAPPLLQRLAWVTLGWNVLVILWGAVVRATGSGAGCGNHWPLCNGEVIPTSPRIATVIEFTHRMMTGGSSFLVLGLLVFTMVAMPKGHKARIAAVVSTLLLANEAILGAVLVKLGYVTDNKSLGRVIVLSIHLSNTLLLVAALTVTAALLAKPLQRVVLGAREGMFILLGLIGTLVVGVSGSLAALGDTLFPSTSLSASFAQDFSTASPLLLRLRWVHPAAASIAGLFVLWLVVRGIATGRGMLAKTVLALLGFQFVLGIADVLLLAPVWMQILHLFGADLYWIALVLLTLAIATREPPRSDLASYS